MRHFLTAGVSDHLDQVLGKGWKLGGECWNRSTWIRLAFHREKGDEPSMYITFFPVPYPGGRRHCESLERPRCGQRA
jgi:hypothetical protein